MRERRPSGLAQQAALAVAYQHNRHRISAREVLRIARRTLAHVSAAPHLGRMTADRAEPVTVVPVELRPSLCQDTCIVPTEKSSRRPCVREPYRVVRPQPRRRAARRRHVHREVSNAVLETQEHRLTVHPEPFQVPRPQPVQRLLMTAVVQRDVELRHQQKPALRVLGALHSARLHPAAGGHLCPAGYQRIRGACRACGVPDST